MSNRDDSLTHKDLARALGVSETTIKSYRRKFPLFFPLHSQGKPLRFKPATLDVCHRIREGFLKDLSTEEVRRILTNEFQGLGKEQTISSPSESCHRQPPAQGNQQLQHSLDSIALGLDALLKSQQNANQKLAELQELMADFLSLHLSREDTFSQGLEELKRSWNKHLQRLREQHPQLPPQAQPPAGPKRVVVRNAYGQRNEYLIDSPDTGPLQKRAPSAAAAPGQNAPPVELLRMPLVIRTGSGEYLGVAGKAEGKFSIEDLLHLLQQAYSPPHHFSGEWSAAAGEGAWRLQLEQEDAIRPRIYALEVTPVETPKGNRVALLSRFEIQGAEMPPPNLYALIRQLREGLS